MRLLKRKCIHCKRGHNGRSGRNLCRNCWDDTDIRYKYPTLSTFGGLTAGNMAKLRPSHMADDKWIEYMLVTLAADKLREFGGKNTLTLLDAYHFFGGETMEAVAKWHIRMNLIDITGQEKTSHINFLRVVADHLETIVRARDILTQKGL